MLQRNWFDSASSELLVQMHVFIYRIFSQTVFYLLPHALCISCKDNYFLILTGLVRPRSNLDSLTSILTRIELVIGDITDPFRMIDVINSTRPKYLYHFAAQGRIREFRKSNFE
jgi:hypothetical protein